MSEPVNKHEAQAAYDKARAALMRFKADSLEERSQISVQRRANAIARAEDRVARAKACLEARTRRARLKTDHVNPEDFPEPPDKLSHRIDVRTAQLAELAGQPPRQSAYQIWLERQWAGVRKAELALAAAEQALKIKIAKG